MLFGVCYFDEMEIQTYTWRLVSCPYALLWVFDAACPVRLSLAAI